MKKTTSLLMAIIIFATTIVTSLTLNNQVYAGVNDFLINTEGKWIGGASYGNSPIQATVEYTKVKDENGNDKTAYAYCIEPKKDGVGSTGPYTVDASTNITDPVLYGIILNGFPNKTPAQMGVANENEAYYITKTAINIHTQYSELALWRATTSSKQYIVDKAKELYTLGKTYTAITKPKYTATPKTPEIEINGTNFEQTFSVKADAVSNDYKVTITGTAPTGTKITDISGNPKDSFPITEKFKVVFPVSSVTVNGSFDLKIEGALKTNVILYGESNNEKRQDYAIAKEFSVEDTIAKVNYTKNTTTPEPSSTPTPSPESGSGKLLVIKKQAGTLIPLAGAQIKLTKADGGVYGIKSTNANGEATFENLPLGEYFVEEITPPHGHLLDINSHKDIVLIKEKSQQTVTFENEKTPTLEVIKKDAETGEPVPNTVFEVSLDGGTEKYTITTDGTGSAKLGLANILKPGTYKVRETLVPEPYHLDPTKAEKYVKLEPGKSASVTFENKKKKAPTIWKYIEGTSTLLDGAEFAVYKKGSPGSLVWSGIVAGGTFTLPENLEPGWYTFNELSAPNGYLITTKTKDVYIEDGKHVDVKFDNRPRPELEILKVDEKGNPLANALFQIKKADGATIFEKMTDKNGQIYIPFNDKDIKLEEGVYTITETKAPDGYIKDKNCIQNVTLEWGQKKTLTFTNTKEPGLTILKIDEETKAPLTGAKFRIKRAENATIKEAVSDKNGKIELTNLEPGIYTIEEIVAPSGYILDPQHKDIELKPGDSKELIFTNKAKPGLRIQKVDAKTGELLKNAEFRVTKFENKTVSEYILENGEITLNNLDEAIYRVEEFMAPDGYVMLTQSKEISTEWGKTKTLKFDNVRKPIVMFLKTNGLTGEPIPGAKFKIEHELPDGGIKDLGSFTTNADGRIIIPRAEPGWYVFTETLPAPGFSEPSNPVTRKYFAPGVNSYLPEFDKYYTSGTGKYASGYAPKDGTTNKSVTTSNANTTTNTSNITSNNTNPSATSKPLKVEVHSGSEYATNEGYNWPLNSIVIKKTDATTGGLLEGAAFELYRADQQVSGVPGTNVGRYTTDHSGIVVITGLKPGYYVVKEVQAPQHYTIDENSIQNGFLKADGTTVLEFTYKNHPYGAILVTKVDGATGKPLAGAKFKVTDNAGTVVGNTTGEFVTDSKGEFLVKHVKPGSYVITEIQAPENYAINTTPKAVQVGTDGKTYKLSFDNYPYGSLVIKKLDSDTKEPLKDAEFKITTADGNVVGNGNGYFTTDEKGTIIIPNLPKGSYVIKEIKAPKGHILENETKTIAIDYGKSYTLEFFNKKMSSMQIIKIDAKTKQPLKDAEFKVYKMNGELLGIYKTNGDGLIIFDDLQPGWYKAVESKAPAGYKIDDIPKDIEITGNQFVKVVFENQPLASLIIKKIDDKSGAPLAGARFKVERQNGEIVGEYSTDKDGLINVPTLNPDYYIIREQKSPDGYVLEETPKTLQVKTGVPTIATFTNKKMTSLEIKKIDSVTGSPLPGARFTVEKQNGEKIYTKENGTEFTTDAQGLINIPTLAPDYYIVREVKQPYGYILDETPKTVQVKTDSPTVITFSNKPLAGLKIIKIDSVTRNPIEGAEFAIAKMNGEKVQNDFKGYTFKTDKTGQIYVPGLPDGYYTVTETKAPDGYELDGQPKQVEIKSGKPTILEVENRPGSGLLIVKTDSRTGKPLQGVVFDVKRADGQRVTGNILDRNQPNTANNSPNKSTSPNGDISGSYTTDASGRILINTLAPGEYHVVETKALKGYELDKEVRSVTVLPGKQASLQIKNKPMAGLRLLKIDSVTKKGIYNVEFRVYDFETNKEVGGPYYSDNNGVVDFTGILPEGRYKIVETREAEGYLRDNTPKTIEFKAGMMTEATWENTPQMGQIQITKKSASDNEVNGLPAGTPLEGAVFEVRKYKTGNVIGQFKTGPNGVGVSMPLPIGRYTIHEIQAPKYYKISDKVLDVDVEFSTQILKFEYTNEPANLGVDIKKTGPQEVMPGQPIRWDIKTVGNSSTVALSDFYWRDIVPGNAVKIDKIITGTYNQSVRYKVMCKTNKNDYRVLYDNLSSTKNNAIDASPSATGLYSDEYITEIMFVFGNVKAGFLSVEQPQIYGTVKTGLPNGYQFSNKADVGGRYGQEWVIGNTAWTTTVYAPGDKKHPRTGY